MNQKPQEHDHPYTTESSSPYNVKTEHNRYKHYELTTKKNNENIKETNVQSNTFVYQESSTLRSETTKNKVVATSAVKDPDWFQKDLTSSEPIWVHGNSFPRNILRQEKATNVKNTRTTQTKEHPNINQQLLEPTSLASEFPHTSQYLE